MKAVTQLKQTQNNLENLTPEEIDEALAYNRRLWVIFAVSASEDDSSLPLTLRQNIASLATFIFKHMLQMGLRPKAQDFDILIDINRNIAAGLRGYAPTQEELEEAEKAVEAEKQSA